MFGIFESMTFLFPQVGIFPKQPKTNRQKYQGLLKDSWRLREWPVPGPTRYPGTSRTLHNSSCGTCRTKSWKNMQGACRNHQRLDHASAFFSRKTVVGCLFYKRVMFVWRNTCYMSKNPRTSLSHYVYIYIVNFVIMYTYIFFFSVQNHMPSYSMIYHYDLQLHHVPWYIIMTILENNNHCHRLSCW